MIDYRPTHLYFAQADYEEKFPSPLDLEPPEPVWRHSFVSAQTRGQARATFASWWDIEFTAPMQIIDLGIEARPNKCIIHEDLYDRVPWEKIRTIT